MTNERTQVDPDELATFGRGAHDRATRTTSVADEVAGIHIGADILGVISTAFTNRIVAEQRDLGSKLHAMAEVLTQDGNTAHANSKAARDNEATQTSQFKQAGS